ncbi:MAG: LacI family DNA-binding transcriptional regulator [Anaerolineae bacterium]|nr:LacI family DNA-binding transcriptional regulator [Anaerolineae bacterium]
MPVTLKDIAREVGVSVTTASRALAGYPDVAPTTRQRVQQVAAALGYVPNTAARNLQRQRTDTLALVLPTTADLRFSDPFFSEFLSGLVQATGEAGFALTVATGSPNDETATYLRLIRSRRADGFVLVRTRRDDRRIALLQEAGVPFVSFGRVNGTPGVHCVDEDDVHGIHLMVDHLAGLGHTRIACIAEPTRFVKGYHRFRGYCLGLEAHGLSFAPDLVVETNYRQRSGYEAAQQLLAMPEPPTAIIACNDLLALGALSAIQARGLQAGHDVSVTGYDNIPLAEHAQPPLTTVDQPADKLGTLVAQMLTSLIRGDPVAEKQVILQPAAVIRQSSGPPPRAARRR